MNWLVKLFSGGRNPIDSVFEGIDRLSTSKEEKEVLRHKALELELDRQQSRLGDKADARAMYAKDNSLQKFFAVLFLVAYIGLTAWLIYLIMSGDIREVSSYETGLLGSIWGSTSAKINTITDFLFGGSQAEKDNKIIQKLAEK